MKWRVGTVEEKNLTYIQPPDDADCQAANIWLLEQLRLGNLSGDYDNFEVFLCTDDGTRLYANVNDRDEAGNDALALSNSESDIRLAVGSMIAARRMFAMASQKLTTLLERSYNLPAANGVVISRPPHPLTQEVLIQSTASAGAKPFNQLDLLSQITERVLPWLKSIVQDNAKAEVAARQEDETRVQQARLKTKVPLGVKHSPDDSDELPRGTSLVLVGWWPAVKIVLDTITSHVLAATNDKHPNKVYSVMRLYNQLQCSPSSSPWFIVAGRNRWQGVGRNEKRLSAFLAQVILPQLTALPDLVVTDNLSALADFTQPTSFLSYGFAPFLCNEAHKILQKRMQNVGCVLVSGVAMEQDKPFDLTTSDWEPMRTHSIFRPVTVLRASTAEHHIPEGKWRIVVGKNAWHVDVEPGALAPESKIIVPT